MQTQKTKKTSTVVSLSVHFEKTLSIKNYTHISTLWASPKAMRVRAKRKIKQKRLRLFYFIFFFLFTSSSSSSFRRFAFSLLEKSSGELMWISFSLWRRCLLLSLCFSFALLCPFLVSHHYRLYEIQFCFSRYTNISFYFDAADAHCRYWRSFGFKTIFRLVLAHLDEHPNSICSQS